MTESHFRVVADMVARECPDAKLALEGREPLAQHIRLDAADGKPGTHVADVRSNEPPRFLARRIVDAIRGTAGKAEETFHTMAHFSGKPGVQFTMHPTDEIPVKRTPVERTPVEEPRCEFCGYTELDKRTLMDHYICEEKQVAERQKKAPKTLVAGDPDVVMVAVPRGRVDEVNRLLEMTNGSVKLTPGEFFIMGSLQRDLHRVEQQVGAAFLHMNERMNSLAELIQKKTGGRK